MLDPVIIAEILKREAELRQEKANQYAELPVDNYKEDRLPMTSPVPEESNRGIITIDI